MFNITIFDLYTKNDYDKDEDLLLIRMIRKTLTLWDKVIPSFPSLKLGDTHFHYNFFSIKIDENENGKGNENEEPVYDDENVSPKHQKNVRFSKFSRELACELEKTLRRHYPILNLAFVALEQTRHQLTREPFKWSLMPAKTTYTG